MMRKAITLALLFTAALAAQRVVPNLNDGEDHGDPPYMQEEGWRPLLNGKDVAGWHGMDPKAPFGWITMQFVRWERLLGRRACKGSKGRAGSS